MRASSPRPPRDLGGRDDRFVFPASFAQQRLWFLEQLEPGTHVYNLPKAFLLEGALNVEALERSFEEIARRHESLRTTFVEEKDGPVQVIHPPGDFQISRRDLEAVEWDRERAPGIVSERARMPFDLSRGPLFRVDLFRLGPHEHVLLVNMHHIVGDGWSFGVLHRELEALYGAFAREETSPLADLPIQYPDYAAWQRERLTGAVLERELAFWRGKLVDAPEVLSLPADRARPVVQTFRGAKVPVKLPEAVSEGVRRLGQADAATPFMVLLAALQVLLSRRTQQQDIVIGTTVANRDRLKIEGLIGFFVNMLVLRTDLSGDPTFRELLRRVRSGALEAYAHAELPFEKLVLDLSPRRQLSHTPLFQVLFGLRSPMAVPQLDGLSVSRMALDSETAKFDLTMILEDANPEIAGWLQYNADLFDASTAARMVEHFEVLLNGIVTNPDERISRLPVMSEGERERVLVEWNRTTVANPRDETVQTLFEAQVERSPESIAVEFEGHQLTYRDLNRRSNQLAHQLRAMGVGSEVLVGLCMERSLEMVVGLLGILKAGGAYVPLDPAYPKERLAFMLQDTQAPVLLTQQGLLEKVPGTTAQLLCIDRDWSTIDKQDSNNPRLSDVSPQNLAYVIYTSGSTGKPKGVAIEHRSAVTFLYWAREAFAVEDLAGVVASTSVCFDLSVFEILGPLSWGGRAVLVTDALSLRSLMPSPQVRLVNTVPSALGEVLRLGPLPASIRTVNLAGEALPQSLVNLIYGQGTVEAVFNLYGPTEDTTYSTWTRVEPGAERGPAIGRPIANTRAYILDGARQPVPIGTAGELYLAGWGLARGYLNHPELTAEKFIADPFAVDPGGRLYRTGDLARYREDGQIEYFGRLDQQVKLRGYRIELGEIQAALADNPRVRDSAVVLREDKPGEPRLVAYIVAPDIDEPNVTELRRHLREKLPDYMVPSAFVKLEAMPRTPNGKLDHRALPAPGTARPQLDQDPVASRTPLEEVLAGIWGQLLGLDSIGVNDSFFALGGHSLLATQVVSRIRASFGIELPLRRIFDSPTVAGLGREIEGLLAGPQARTLPPLAAVARDGDLPLSFAQERLWFLDQLHPGSSGYNVFEAVALEGTLDREALRRSLEAIVHRHEALRTRLPAVDGLPVQVIGSPARLDLPVHDLRHLSSDEKEHESRRLTREYALRPFDMSVGPVFRAAVLALGPTSHVLVWAMHHISSDGWSLAIFRRELAAFYAAFTSGAQPALPQLPVQYADFAVWQRKWLAGEELDSQLAFWRDRLEGLERLRLPVDRTRSEARTGRGAHTKFRLPADLSDALRESSRRQDVTLFMTLLAAFQTLLHHATGQEDIALGTDVANRRHVAIEGLVGFFANLLVLRSDLSGDPTFEQLLSRVREDSLGAYAHQDLPFAKLVSGLRAERSLSDNPLVQTLLVQNNAGPPLALPGLEARRLETESGLAKFDLAVFVDDKPSGLEFSWRYASDLFELATIARLAGQFESLLGAVVSDPSRRLSELRAAPSAERGGARSRKPAADDSAPGIQGARRKAVKL